MDTQVLIEDLNSVYALDLRPAATVAELETFLSEKVNHMIQHDFQTLLQLLYRIDVNEEKLRRELEQNKNEDAGRIIARLIIERQTQKIESRRQFRKDTET
jgi:hypothetical protein